MDVSTSGFSDKKRYVVQTNPRVISRCILMTTDPGDLVLDPTCGSGTTAFVAEQWGRRWLTCDTSRVALSIARQRMLTAKFPFYELRTAKVKDGFKYKTVPHITLKSIAQDPRLDGCSSREQIEKLIASSAEQQTLYDQPVEDRKRVRVAGPFTVEAITLASIEEPQRNVGSQSNAKQSVGAFSDDVQAYLGTMMDLLRRTGVNFPENERLRLPNLRSVKGNFKWFHAEGETETHSGPADVAVSFGPRHGPITPTQVLGAITETRGKQLVLFVGFACDPEARKIIDRGASGRKLAFANAAPDIIMGDLLKHRRSDQLFTVFGAPDVRVHRESDSLVSVELVAIDLYDPTTGETHDAGPAKAAAMFVDHDYDGKSFCVSQALFPGGGPNAWEKIKKALKSSVDAELFDRLKTARSAPFKPGARIAVKVIDDRGNEVIKLLDTQGASPR